MKKEKVYVGIDVAKAHLDLAFEQVRGQLCNDARGHRALVQRLAQLSASPHVICEASGGYERGLVLALAQAQIDGTVAPASPVRPYARACGILAKTDRDRCPSALSLRPGHRAAARQSVASRAGTTNANSRANAVIWCVS
jgi:transposase